ncbi:MAG: hypothetical protein M3Z85_02585 [Acidobacteriota bacterium]|nr:hypothetical protein [Acidobacteriota bacterium]
MLSQTTLWKTARAATLCAAAFSYPGLAQVPPPTILRIDTANVVLYIEDVVADPAKVATDPNVTTLTPPKNFFRNAVIGDILAVNGQRVMGTQTGTGPGGGVLRIAPTPGQAIADTVRNAVQMISFEILKSDGTPIGTIMGSGFTGGVSPPGSPLNVTGNNFVVTGGTGAFLGARGQAGTAANPPGVAAARGASITEDPANRRRNGGGSQQWVVHLIPLESPEIVMSTGGPAISHSSDFSLVTASKPAAAGETLSLFARGLGPVKPGVDPGTPFPSSRLAVVNSPVEVTVNGKAAEVLSAVGYPGAVDGYQVNFRVPSDAAKGPASIQVSAAWILGTSVSIPVQ